MGEYPPRANSNPSITSAPRDPREPKNFSLASQRASDFTRERWYFLQRGTFPRATRADVSSPSPLNNKRKAEGEAGAKGGKKADKIAKDGKKKRPWQARMSPTPTSLRAPRVAKHSQVDAPGPKINAANPDLKFAEIAKMLGEQWKNMTPPPALVTRRWAEQDKERYQRDKAATQAHVPGRL